MQQWLNQGSAQGRSCKFGGETYFSVRTWRAGIWQLEAVRSGLCQAPVPCVLGLAKCLWRLTPHAGKCCAQSCHLPPNGARREVKICSWNDWPRKNTEKRKEGLEPKAGKGKSNLTDCYGKMCLLKSCSLRAFCVSSLPQTPVRWARCGMAPGQVCLSSRCVFVRLANIGVLLFSLWSHISDCATDECKACGYNYELYPVSRFILAFNHLNLWAEICFPRALFVGRCSDVDFHCSAQSGAVLTYNLCLFETLVSLSDRHKDYLR